MEDTRRIVLFFFFQEEDGIRDLGRSGGVGDVYKRQGEGGEAAREGHGRHEVLGGPRTGGPGRVPRRLLYTS